MMPWQLVQRSYLLALVALSFLQQMHNSFHHRALQPLPSQLFDHLINYFSLPPHLHPPPSRDMVPLTIQLWHLMPPLPVPEPPGGT